MKTRHYLTPEDIGKIRHMIEVEGLQQWKVADEIGVHLGTIEKVCGRIGLQTQRTGPRSGEGHTNWQGGATIRKGYRYIYCPEHPHAVFGGRYVAEHRLAMEKKLGRYLDPKEVVHHIDSDRLNNDPENLIVFGSNAQHLKHELTGRIPNWSSEGWQKMQDAIQRRVYRDRHRKESGGDPQPQASDHPAIQSDSTGGAPAS